MSAVALAQPMLVRVTLLALLLTASAAGALPLPPLPCGLDPDACVVPDPSFETGGESLPEGWELYVSGPCDGSGVAPSSAAARTGGMGIRVVDRSDLCTGFYTADAIPLTGAHEYNASLQVRAVEGAPDVRLMVVWYANDGSNLGDYLYKDGFQISPGADWTPLWSRTVAPVDAMSARLLVYAPATSAGTFDVDDAALVSGSPGVPPLL